MVEEASLTTYVENLLRQGYTRGQVTEYLRSRGYPASMVEAAFRSVDTTSTPTLMQATTTTAPAVTSSTPSATSTTQNAPSATPSMVDQLTAYVRTYLAQGYDARQLRSFLVGQGYAQADVDAAVNAATGQGGAPTIHHEVNFGKGTLVAIALLLVLGAALFGGIKFFMGGGGDTSVVTPQPGVQRLLDVSFSLDESVAAPGESVVVDVNVVNMGEDARFDVDLSFVLEDAFGAPVWSESKTKAIATSFDTTMRLPLPDDLDEGDYTVVVTARYGGESPAVAKKILRVAVKPEEVEAPNDTNTTSSTGDTFIIINKGTEEDALEDAARAARSGDVQTAIGTCRGVENQARRDRCLATVVIASQEVAYCDEISSREEREQCIMPFVLEGRHDLCDKVESPERVKLCENLIHLASLESLPPTTTDINDFTTPS